MATAVATKRQRGHGGAGNGKAANFKDTAGKALAPEVSEVGGMKVDRSLEKRVDHISSEEAERQGKTARVAVAHATRRLGGAGRAPQPGRRHHRAGHHQGARPGADPPWADDGLALHVLSRGGGGDGRGPGRHAFVRVQGAVCGDAHLLNFGGFTSPERTLLFDVNDFDETLPGPWEWDVKRLAASIEVAGRDGQLKPADRRNAVEATARQYREAMRSLPPSRSSGCGTPASTVTPSSPLSGLRGRQGGAQPGSHFGQGSLEGQHEGVHQAHPAPGRRARSSPPTHLLSSRCETSSTRKGSQSSRTNAPALPGLPAHPPT